MRQEEWRKRGGREVRRKKTGEEKERNKEKAEGEPACLHASNLLMVEGKQTISHYLSKT